VLGYAYEGFVLGYAIANLTYQCNN